MKQSHSWHNLLYKINSKAIIFFFIYMILQYKLNCERKMLSSFSPLVNVAARVWTGRWSSSSAILFGSASGSHARWSPTSFLWMCSRLLILFLWLLLCSLPWVVLHFSRLLQVAGSGYPLVLGSYLIKDCPLVEDGMAAIVRRCYAFLALLSWQWRDLSLRA